jgi:hypothetical protein
MREETVVSLLADLPDSATNAEALAWVKRMRRVINRWESLPGYEERSMTPDLKRQAHAELDEVEHSVRRTMALPEGA